MQIYLPEMEEIYFPKTKEYFKEVISSYSIGNYRSATVMLYSVAICDILFKLQELKDMYNDTVADEILKEVDKSRNDPGNNSKSKWEKELIDNVYNRTELLDLEALTNLNHLFDHRNFSAHPALNENYELIAPSKETTIANIKNILNNILVKPPIFIKNIVNTLTEDLKGKNTLYKNEYDKLTIYLNNKYFSKMSKSMKLVTFKAFWKFCFCLPNDEDCINNFAINRKALEVLIAGFQKDAIEYVKENQNMFSIANNENCQMNLIFLLSKHPALYDKLNSDTQLQVDALIDKVAHAKALAWFKYKTVTEHLSVLKSIAAITLPQYVIDRMVSYYSDIGEMTSLIDFFVWYYGKSTNFDTADCRFELVIEPFLDKMSAKQIEEIIANTHDNSQISGRRLAYSDNNKIIHYAKNILANDFDYSKYSRFRFDNKILHPEKDDERSKVPDDFED